MCLEARWKEEQRDGIHARTGVLKRKTDDFEHVESVVVNKVWEKIPALKMGEKC